jgi:hypothetical protein
MRGSPPLHFILFLLLFLLLMVPLAHLTDAPHHPAPAAATPSQTAPEGLVESLVRVRTAHPAAKLSLKLEGKELLPAAAGSTPPTRIEFRCPLPNPKEGFELVVTAEWPPGTPDTAVTIEVEPDGWDLESMFLWSSNGRAAASHLFRW